MGSVVTTIFFAEVAMYCDGAKDKHPQGGPASTSSSTTMMAAAGALGSTPRGPAVDVFINYDGGRWRSSWQHHQGARNRCVAWYLSPAFLLSDTYQGATMANATMAGRTKFHRKIFPEKG
jgi:hypothetical protein